MLLGGVQRTASVMHKLAFGFFLEHGVRKKYG